MNETALHHAATEGQHFVAKNLGMGVSKGSLHVLNGGEALTHGLEGGFKALNAVGNNLGVNGAFAAVGGLGGVVAIGTVGAVSAAVAQMDYLHEISKMKELYRNEIAAKIGKPAKSITNDDLFMVAKGDPVRGIEGNKIIADEIAKKRSERTLGVVLSAGATMASFALVSTITKSILTPLADVAAASIGLPGAATAALLLIEVAVGIGAYNMVKQPLHWLGHKIFGLDKETTHDRIEHIQKDLAKGRGVTQEQVLGVFVSANTQLDQFITNEYGKDFHSLNQHERMQVVNDINKLVPLAQMTGDINSGKYDIGELAYAAEGKASGYIPHQEERPQNWLTDMASKLTGMFHYKSQQPKQQAQADVSAGQQGWHPADEQKSKQSFVDRYAPGRRAPAELGHVERLEQARSDNPALGSQLA